MNNIYTFSHDILMFDVETTTTWPEQNGKLCEFGAITLDRKTLDIKDEFHVYIKVSKNDFNNAPDVIKKMHGDKWKYYLGIEEPTDCVVIEQNELVPVIKAKYKDHQHELCAWNLEFDFHWLMHYFKDDKFFSNFSKIRFDLKSIYRAMFILNKNHQEVVTSKHIRSLFGVSEVSHNALDDCHKQAELLRIFCNIPYSQ
jgi:DNA polymerase III epsilon subunit-like protein